MPGEELCNGLRRYVFALKYVQLEQIGTIPVVVCKEIRKSKFANSSHRLPRQPVQALSCYRSSSEIQPLQLCAMGAHPSNTFVCQRR